MRTTILVALTILLAGEAHASEWAGSWTVEGGGTRTLDETGATLALDVTLPVDGGQASFHLRGGAMGQSKVRLQGEGTKTVGEAGALSGEHGHGKYRATLEADMVEGSVNARFSVSSKVVQQETWHRGNLEIVSLESDGKPLQGDFDAKLSGTGLVVKFRVRATLDVTAQVVVGPGHPYSSFYATPEIFVKSLGSLEPGDHELTWDGRDQTDAARIALGGPYTVVLLAEKEKAERGFSVAPPRFETVGSHWTAGSNDDSGSMDWNPEKHLELLSWIVSQRPLTPPPLSGLSPPGFSTPAPHIVKDSQAITDVLSKAGSFVIETHGTDAATIAVFDGTLTRLYAPSPGELKDVHFAFANCCMTAKDAKGGSFCDRLIASGCDVAIGFKTKVLIDSAADFATFTILLLSRGDPIAKAAEDAKGPATSPYETTLAGVRDPLKGSVASSMVVRRAKGIEESESMWPPRYGNSKN